jgi:hypothetical protein
VNTPCEEIDAVLHGPYGEELVHATQGKQGTTLLMKAATIGRCEAWCLLETPSAVCHILCAWAGRMWSSCSSLEAPMSMP